AAGAVLTLRWRLAGGGDEAAAAAGLAGRRVGPYVLDTALGDGVLGDVYLARHEALRAERAVQVMKAAAAGHPQVRAAFLARARDGRALVGGFAVAPVPEGAPEPVAAGDVAAFAALLLRLASGLAVAPEAGHATGGALADAYLAATDRGEAETAPVRWRPPRRALAAVATAVVLGTTLLTGAELAARGHPPARADAPRSVRGQLGRPG